MGERIPRPGEQHPAGWREDLNPNAMAGQNLGITGPHDDKRKHNAYEIKELHERMPEFTDDEPKSVPVLRLARRHIYRPPPSGERRICRYGKPASGTPKLVRAEERSRLRVVEPTTRGLSATAPLLFD